MESPHFNRDYIAYPETVMSDRHKEIIAEFDEWRRPLRLSHPGNVRAEAFYDVFRTHLEIDAEQAAYNGKKWVLDPRSQTDQVVEPVDRETLPDPDTNDVQKLKQIWAKVDFASEETTEFFAILLGQLSPLDIEGIMADESELRSPVRNSIKAPVRATPGLDKLEIDDFPVEPEVEV
jgi:hypothetical protein